jgi:hypothetical protein
MRFAWPAHDRYKPLDFMGQGKQAGAPLMSADDTPNVVLWPRRENYARFRALCDDDVPETFDGFEALAIPRLEIMADRGVFIERINFDPDLMAQWCRAHFDKVDSEARKHYAAFLSLTD